MSDEELERTDQKSDYTWEGDTWWTANTVCPDCTAVVVTNGSINDCVECDWWEVES